MTAVTDRSLDERRLNAWHDRDRDGAWQMWAMCHACGEMAHCRGKERDLIRCFTCYADDVEAVPLIELNLISYTNRDEALTCLSVGRKLLREQKERAVEARRAGLAETNERKRLEREWRDEEMALLYRERGRSIEELAANFNLKPSTVRRIVSSAVQTPVESLL